MTTVKMDPPTTGLAAGSNDVTARVGNSEPTSVTVTNFNNGGPLLYGPEHWFGMIDGLLIQALSIGSGEFTELATVGPGTWFGEGTLLKKERWRYEVVALRRSHVAVIPLDLFKYLRETSLLFNHFIADLLNARLGMCIGLLVAERLLDPESKVARLLASLCMAEQLAAQGPFIPLRQAEIARLAGLSRQRTNVALHKLQQREFVEVKRDGVIIRDLIGLRTLEPPRHWIGDRNA